MPLAQNVSKFIQTKFYVNTCDFDKENNALRSNEIVTNNLEYNYQLQDLHDKENSQNKSSIIIKNMCQTQQQRQPLWAPSETTCKELNIPISVKQAKLCFESMENRNGSKSFPTRRTENANFLSSCSRQFKGFSQRVESSTAEDIVKVRFSFVF